MRTTYIDVDGVTRCRLCRQIRCGRIPSPVASRWPRCSGVRSTISLRSPLQPHPRMPRSAAQELNRFARDERKAHVRRAGLPGEQARRARELAHLARLADARNRYLLFTAAALSRAVMRDAETCGVRLPRSALRYHRCCIALAEALRG